MPRPKPLILTILDGWGFSPAVEAPSISSKSQAVESPVSRFDTSEAIRIQP